jgi:hypothetical protein
MQYYKGNVSAPLPRAGSAGATASATNDAGEGYSAAPARARGGVGVARTNSDPITNSNSNSNPHSNTALSVEPIDFVSGVDDEKFLVDQFEALVHRSVASNRPFLAVICFHGVHIPYVATPATRASDAICRFFSFYFPVFESILAPSYQRQKRCKGLG